MPIPDGLTPGERPAVFVVRGLKLSPSVCLENTVPHLIRRQVIELRDGGNEPDVLVTLSNDGWFWGSSELDMHLTCGRFRAIELRKPALIAANTGLSAHIDGNGRLLQVGPRRQTQVLIAQVQPDGRASLYSRIGDAPANVCLLACVAIALVGTTGWWRSPRE
jgi:apolipoprotein N-acyltransferase